jgi:hypothetical protein
VAHGGRPAGPYRLPLAAAMSASTSSAVRWSRVRNSAFGRRSGMTVRFSVVGATRVGCGFMIGNPLAPKSTGCERGSKQQTPQGASATRTVQYNIPCSSTGDLRKTFSGSQEWVAHHTSPGSSSKTRSARTFISRGRPRDERLAAGQIVLMVDSVPNSPQHAFIYGDGPRQGRGVLQAQALRRARAAPTASQEWRTLIFYRSGM